MKVSYIDHCGTDLTFVNSARRSFGRKSDWIMNESGEKTLKDSDISLLEYLVRGMSSKEYTNLMEQISKETDINAIEEMIWKFRKTPEHDTPLNHSLITLDVEAPIFSHRHLIKHEYMICSEFSRRYIKDDLRFYLPLVHRFGSSDVKQGSSSEQINTETLNKRLSKEYDIDINEIINKSTQLFSMMTSESENICIEQARAYLPLSLMTSWTWSGTLCAYTKMCNLRLDSHTQLETRLIAQMVRDILYELYPISARLLIDYPSYIGWKEKNRN